MDIKQIKENKIRMILQFSIPSIIAMLLQTVITITDGYFTGNYVGQNALAAINLGLPILYFYLGTGLCIGVGGSVISGRMLGANERKKSSEVFSQTVVAALITCVPYTNKIVFIAAIFIFGILAVGNTVVKNKRWLVHASAYLFMAFYLGVGILASVGEGSVQERTQKHMFCRGRCV